MLQFSITNMQLSEVSFDVPSAYGLWEFRQAPWYSKVVPAINGQGAMGNTYLASNTGIDSKSKLSDFEVACVEITDICLLLSFLNGRCVAPSGTTQFSSPQIMQLGDKFIRPRAIAGFDEIGVPSMSAFFQDWLTTMYPSFLQRKLRLQLVHWLSGCTCFSMEDLYQSIGVQFDLIKQVEISATGQSGMHYFKGMQSASSRYGITPLSHDFTKMRNDIIHEGVLSGTNFSNKSKSDCATLIADTLNWLDLYMLSILGSMQNVQNVPRWKSQDVENYLPAFTL